MTGPPSSDRWKYLVSRQALRRRPSAPPARAPRPPRLRRLALAIAAAVAVALAAIALAPLRRETASGWTYYEQRNGTGGIDHYATITSSNAVGAASPHGAPLTMDMTIRQPPTGPADIAFEVSSGDLMCASFAGCSATVRFDDGPEQAFAFEGFLESHTNTMFVRDPERFLDGLTRAKRVTIAKAMLGTGTRRFRFDVAGLRLAP